MTFLKLTDTSGDEIYINIDTCALMYRHPKDDRTILIIPGEWNGALQTVKETPEEILKLARGEEANEA